MFSTVPVNTVNNSSNLVPSGESKVIRYIKRKKYKTAVTPFDDTNTEILMVIYKDKGVPTLMTTKTGESFILDDDDLNNLNNSTIPEKLKTIQLVTDTIHPKQLETINSSIDSVLKEKSKSIIGLGTGKSKRQTKSLVGGKRVFKKTKTRKNKKYLAKIR